MTAEMKRELDAKALKDAVWLALYLAEQHADRTIADRLLVVFNDVVQLEQLSKATR